MRRKYNPRDKNEKPITEALRRVGATVVLLAGTDGLPDLLVGYQGRTILMEVKREDTSRVKTNKSKGRKDGLDPDQAVFFAKWRGGPCVVVKSVDEAMAALRSTK